MAVKDKVVTLEVLRAVLRSLATSETVTEESVDQAIDQAGTDTTQADESGI